MEIEAIAARTDESPRRVRARIEKEGLADALASQILERKTLDRILEYVKFEEVAAVEEEVAVETLDQTATPRPPRPRKPDEAAEPAARLRPTAAARVPVPAEPASERLGRLIDRGSPP